MTASPFDPLSFTCGARMANRLTLAPMTNTQSHADGRLSDDEFNWLTMRARGGFGLTMTCAAHVQASGQGFPGQLGIFSDAQLDGLTRLAAEIQRHESLAVAQLYHGGQRSPAELIGEAPVCASADEKTGARALELGEVERLRDDFIAAALRAQRAGFDGVQLHGAHGYILAQFISPKINRREDRYGGPLENRARLLLEIIDGVRAACGASFLLGVRLSPERFGMKLAEVCELSTQLLAREDLDFLEMSLWDSFKQPHEEQHQGRSLLSYFTQIERTSVRLGVAGKLYSAADVREALAAGVDFVSLGRAAILHHDFPKRMQADPEFRCRELPVSREYLRAEGLGDAFIEYMSRWDGFVAAEASGPASA